MPTFWRYYGTYSSNNYGLHCLAFKDAEGNEFYYSYNTLVAFKVARTGKFFCSTNDWSVTTGKHLNAIEPDKSKRVPHDEFLKIYEVAFQKEEALHA